MAVIGQIVVESRRYSGWVDARYPIGYWQAALTVTGDATGGLLGIDLVFQPATAPELNSQIYSVERLAASQNNGANQLISVEAVNMGGPDNEGFVHQYVIPMTGRTGGGRAALSGTGFTFLPWFLGSQRIAGTSASVSFVTANVDTVVTTFEAEGYRWSARSVLVDGGPQRPPTGPYRS